MLKNYFITAINNLLKNKLYSAINIIGLAVGLAACILITLHVQDELSYDKHWEKADLIYRVNKGDSPDTLDLEIPGQILPALKKYFPEEIEFGIRIGGPRGGDYEEIEIGNMRYHEKVYFVDKDFIKIFQIEELNGSLKSTLQSPGNIALSEEYAAKYFGEKDPIGEIITIIPARENREQYKVTAVYRLTPPNTVLNLPALTLINEGFSYSCETYIRFNDTADIERFVNRIPDFVDKGIPNNMGRGGFPSGKKESFSIQKMSDIYFNPIISRHDPPPSKIGNTTVITVFIIISVLVLIIGCINFIILTTANGTQRAREVAMRKVVGARFKQLVFQFLGESILVTFIAFLLSVAIVELALPYFELFMNKELTVPYSSPGSYVFVILLLIFVGLIGGLYPGLILSRFSPTQALKANQTTEAGGSIWLRNILVIFQFTVSIILLVATVVAYFQLLYTSKRDPGFNPENLLVVDIDNRSIQSYRNTLQQELLKLPEVTNVSLSNAQPQLVEGGIDATLPFRRKNDNSAPNQVILYRNMYVDYDFFNSYEISLLSGRYFTQGLDQEEPPPFFNTDEIKDRRLIINLAAARQLGYASADEAVGGIIEAYGFGGNTDYSIIGVVEDSQYRSIRIKPKPEIYHLTPDVAAFLNIKYQGDYKAVLKEVQHVWKTVVGDVVIKTGNVKQNLTAAFDQEEKENKVLIAFTLLSVFIACMGLFGMAAFTVERRVKEIGLRKVMGAKVKDIVNLLGWNFLKPVLIANIIAWPVAIFSMQSWLERFPYRFNPILMVPICLGSGLMALAIAWFTVAGNTTRVARSNPIHALRYE